MAAIYFALKYTIGKSAESIQPWWDPNKNTYILWFSIVCGIVLYYGISSYGNKIPGSFFERNEYESMIYIRLYPNKQKTTSRKLPAKIFKLDNKYYIQYIALSGGSYLDICWYEPCIFDDSVELELNRVVTIYDSKNHEWYVELTNESAN